MAMPRPRGKAFSIAKKNIPHLKNSKKNNKKDTTKIEQKIIETNDLLSKEANSLF